MRSVKVRNAVLAAAIACGIGSAAITAAPAMAARPAAGRVFLVTCAGTGATSPARYVIACGDGNDFLKGLNWSSWGIPAKGFGKDAINDCIPTCTGGTFHSYPVNVLLWRVRDWPHHAGKRYCTRMTLTYTKKVPKGLHKTRVIDLPA